MNRNIYLDNIKGALILSVVIGHLFELMRNNFEIGRELFMFIYVFHMPMFTLLSGYVSQGEKGVATAKKALPGLFLPFLIFQILFLIIKYLYTPMTLTDTIGAILTPQDGLWYIFCLFIWRLILPHFVSLPNPMALSIFIGLLGGFLPKYGTLLSSSRMLAFFPFFMLGYYLRTKETFLGHSDTHSDKKLILLSVLTLLCALGCSIILKGNFQEYFLYYHFYFEEWRPVWFSFLFRIIAYSSALLAGFSFMYIVPKSVSILTKLGQKSLYIYLLHCVLIHFLICSKMLSQIKAWYFFLLITLSGFPLTVLLCTNIVQRMTKIFVEPAPVIIERRPLPPIPVSHSTTKLTGLSKIYHSSPR
jgi:fucose 4-O-acetylase-like acetyltransferase